MRVEQLELCIGRVLVVELVIEPKSVAPVEAGNKTIRSREWSAAVFVAYVRPKWHAIVDIQHDVGKAKLLAGFEIHFHLAERVVIEPIQVFAQSSRIKGFGRSEANAGLDKLILEPLVALVSNCDVADFSFEEPK